MSAESVMPAPHEGASAAALAASCEHAHVHPQPVARLARRRRVHQVGAIATGGALGGAAVLVATFDPSAAGSRFPACGFHALTGLWCPGCGLTRATHHLLNGDPLAALATNVFTPLVLTAIVVSWLAWTLRSFGRNLPRPPMAWATPAIRRWSGPVAIGVVLMFGVLRNLPFAPFRSLAP
jgi:hypothetical protein